VHGKTCEVSHRGEGVFRGINGPFQATRYHSLVVDFDTMPDGLAVTAETGGNAGSPLGSPLVMGLAHRTLPVHGVQFHPESIASEHGRLILRNFLDIAAGWNAAARRGRAG
jgi:anthranilate synthase component II